MSDGEFRNILCSASNYFRQALLLFRQICGSLRSCGIRLQYITLHGLGQRNAVSSCSLNRVLLRSYTMKRVAKLGLIGRTVITINIIVSFNAILIVIKRVLRFLLSQSIWCAWILLKCCIF